MSDRAQAVAVPGEVQWEPRARASIGTAPALRGGASIGTSPALRGGASIGTAPALRGGASITRVLAAVLVLGAASLSATPAHAQRADDDEPETRPLKADFKGAVGLGLIGAELGFVVPALAGAKGVWPYIVFPLIGAGGGAAGGYFLLEKGEGHPELAVGALTLGMALVVPAMVATIAATSYRPPEQIESASMKRRRAVAQSGDGLVRWSGEELALAAPNVTVTTSERPSRAATRTGAPQRTSGVRVSLLSGRF
jgi:hypothetical protein